MALAGSDTGWQREREASREAPFWNATHFIHYYCLVIYLIMSSSALFHCSCPGCLVPCPDRFQLQLKSHPRGNELGLCLCRRAAQAGYLFIKALSGNSHRVSITCKPSI